MHRDTPVFPCFTELFLETKQTNYVKDPQTHIKAGMTYSVKCASSPLNIKSYIRKISLFITGENLK